MRLLRRSFARFLLFTLVFNMLTYAAAVEASNTILDDQVITLNADGGGAGDEHERSYHHGGFCDHSCHLSAHLLGIAAGCLDISTASHAHFLNGALRQSARHQVPDTQFRPPRLHFFA
jgi:hypothetical protein